jgi:hypothetical protein
VARGFECTFEELDAIGDALHLDVRPFPFQFPVHGELVDERIRLIQEAHATLTAKGLIEGRRFSMDLEDLVEVFARGSLAIAVVGTVDGEGVCARAVSDGRFGVLARSRGDGVRFDPVAPPSLVRSVLGLLPAARPGPGRSATITVDSVMSGSAATGSPASGPPVSGSSASGSRARDFRVGDPRAREEDFAGRRYLQAVRPQLDSSGMQRVIAEEIMKRPRVGSGYFTVTARGRHGREGEPLTLSWLDTDAGRYAVIPSTGPDGRLHVTYTPVDLARLHQGLTRLVEMMTD